MGYLNRSELREHIGKVGVFYNSGDENTVNIGRLASVTPNGNCEDEDQTYYDEFTPMGKEAMLHLIELEFYK